MLPKSQTCRDNLGGADVQVLHRRNKHRLQHTVQCALPPAQQDRHEYVLHLLAEQRALVKTVKIRTERVRASHHLRAVAPPPRLR